VNYTKRKRHILTNNLNDFKAGCGARPRASCGARPRAILDNWSWSL